MVEDSTKQENNNQGWQEACRELIYEIVSINDDLQIYSLDFIFPKNGLLIVLKLDNLKNPYGSPSVEECEDVAKMVRHQAYDKIIELGGPEDFGVEVSSPGAERELKDVSQFERFKELPFRVSFVDGKEDSKGSLIVTTKILSFIGSKNDNTIWKDAVLKVKKYSKSEKKKEEGNFVIPKKNIKKTNLYLDF